MEPTGGADVPMAARRAPSWVDPLLGAAAVVVAVRFTYGADVAAIDPRLQPVTVPLLVLTAIGASGLSLWRRRPLAGFVIVFACGTVVSAAGYLVGMLPVVLWCCLYALAANGTRVQALLGLGVTAVAYLGLRLAEVPSLSSSTAATGVALSVAAVAVGEVVRLRREHHQELLRAAEARGAVTAERAVAEERLRIARELHDVVAHCMSLIAVQAGVGAHLLRGNPAAAERALEVIADTSRDALAQTRSVVGLLRTGEDAQPSLPGLASVQALVDGVLRAGLGVRLAVTGDVRDLPAVVDLAAYRIVQESLTNAVKHGSDRPVTVVLRYAADDLLVAVSTSDPAGHPSPDRAGPVTPGGAAASQLPTGAAGTGFGLIGLRERARALGGHLDAGPTADGGFAVTAHLPTAQPVGVPA